MLAAQRESPRRAEEYLDDDETAYCSGPGELGPGECGRPVFRKGLCESHVKQSQRGDRKLRPIAEKLTPQQRFREAVIAYANCESDEEFHEAERRLEYAGKQAFGRKNASEAIRRGLAAARAKGILPGPPTAIDPEKARAAVLATGSFRAAALKLRVHWLTVWRATRRPVSGSKISKQPARRPRTGRRST